MGVLPLQFSKGQSRATLGVKGTEVFQIMVDEGLKAKEAVGVRATSGEGAAVEFETVCRIDTAVEIEYYRNGGILQTVLRKMRKEGEG
jgi:aconitate hydratase